MMSGELHDKVATKSSRQNSMTFLLFFHDCITKFHDLLINKHVGWLFGGSEMDAAVKIP